MVGANQAPVTSSYLGEALEQAAEAFLLWRGVRPDGAPVMAMLRSLGPGVAAKQ